MLVGPDWCLQFDVTTTPSPSRPVPVVSARLCSLSSIDEHRTLASASLTGGAGPDDSGGVLRHRSGSSASLLRPASEDAGRVENFAVHWDRVTGLGLKARVLFGPTSFFGPFLAYLAALTALSPPTHTHTATAPPRPQPHRHTATPPHTHAPWEVLLMLVFLGGDTVPTVTSCPCCFFGGGILYPTSCLLAACCLRSVGVVDHPPSRCTHCGSRSRGNTGSRKSTRTARPPPSAWYDRNRNIGFGAFELISHATSHAV